MAVIGIHNVALPTQDSQAYSFDFFDFVTKNHKLNELLETLAHTFTQSTVAKWGTDEKAVNWVFQTLHQFINAMIAGFREDGVTPQMISNQMIRLGLKKVFEAKVFNCVVSVDPDYKNETGMTPRYAVSTVLENEYFTELECLELAYAKGFYANGRVESDYGFTTFEKCLYAVPNWLDVSEHPIETMLLAAGTVLACITFGPFAFGFAVGFAAGGGAIQYAQASSREEQAKQNGDLGQATLAEVDQYKAVTQVAAAVAPLGMKYARPMNLPRSVVAVEDVGALTRKPIQTEAPKPTSFDSNSAIADSSGQPIFTWNNGKPIVPNSSGTLDVPNVPTPNALPVSGSAPIQMTSSIPSGGSGGLATTPTSQTTTIPTAGVPNLPTVNPIGNNWGAAPQTSPVVQQSNPFFTIVPFFPSAGYDDIQLPPFDSDLDLSEPTSSESLKDPVPDVNNDEPQPSETNLNLSKADPQDAAIEERAHDVIEEAYEVLQETLEEVDRVVEENPDDLREQLIKILRRADEKLRDKIEAINDPLNEAFPSEPGEEPHPMSYTIHDMWTVLSVFVTNIDLLEDPDVSLEEELPYIRSDLSKSNLASKRINQSERIAHGLARKAGNKDVQMTNNVPEKVALKPKQTSDWQRVLNNFVTNAVRYSKDGEPVEINVRMYRTSNNKVVLEVEDKGIGFKPESLSKIGQETLQEGRNDVEGSQGIGLQSVADIARRNDWELSISTEEDVGTTWRLIMPEDHFENTPDLDVQEVDSDNYFRIQ